MDFQKFLEENKKELYKRAEDNTNKNVNAVIVITKDDEWRTEDDWEHELKH